MYFTCCCWFFFFHICVFNFLNLESYFWNFRLHHDNIIVKTLILLKITVEVLQTHTHPTPHSGYQYLITEHNLPNIIYQLDDLCWSWERRCWGVWEIHSLWLSKSCNFVWSFNAGFIFSHPFLSWTWQLNSGISHARLLFSYQKWTVFWHEWKGEIKTTFTEILRILNSLYFLWLLSLIFFKSVFNCILQDTLQRGDEDNIM